MSEAPVRWGIIGCGAVTEVKSGPALQQASGSTLQAVMRRDAGKARDYARRHGVPAWYDQAQALIDDPWVDAVYVATPPSSHKPYALAAIAAGKPVYIEKPMALDRAECDAILAAAQRAGVPVFVAYYRRALPRFHTVRRLLREGAIGVPEEVHVHYRAPHHAERYADPRALPWRVQPALSGGGLFVDLGSHTLDLLDLLDWLFGPLAQVQGEASNRLGAYPAEDTVSMRFTLPGGIVGSGTWNFASDAFEDRVDIIGGAGTLGFATFGEGPIVLRDGRGEHVFREANPAHIQQPLIQRMVDALHGRGEGCPSTGESARRTTAVIDAVLAGYRAALGPSGDAGATHR